MGVTRVYDRGNTPAGEGFTGDQFGVTRDLAVGGSYATINAASSDGQAIIATLYPGQTAVPSGKKIAVFGLGRLCNITSTNDGLREVSFYANTDSSQYYNRFLLCFEVDTGGSRARLLGVLGSDGDLLVEEVKDVLN
jgi:hypothetical protein